MFHVLFIHTSISEETDTDSLLLLTNNQFVAAATHFSGGHQLQKTALQQLILDHFREAAADDVGQGQLGGDGQGGHHDRHLLWGGREG